LKERRASDKVCIVTVESLPEVLALSTEEKEILAEELLNQVVLEQDKDPALVDLLRRRLDDHKANPAGGVSWEKLRDPLLKRRHA
jgi:putative addiction module component (TIGR02574 family)